MPYTPPLHGYPSPPVTPVSIVLGWPDKQSEFKERRNLDLCKSVAIGVEECYSEISRQMQMLSLIEEKIVSISAPALGLLNVLSLLSPNDIPEALLNQQLPSDGVLQYPVSGPMYIIARDELLQTGLVKWKRSMDTIRLSIDKDVQDANQCSITTEECQDSFDAVVMLLSRALPRIVDEMRRFTMSQEEKDTFAKLLPFIMTLHERFSETQLWHPPLHIKRDMVWLYHRTAWFLCLEQEYETARVLLELALAISEDHYYDMIDLQVDILYCLARCGPETDMLPRQILRYSTDYLGLCEDMDDESPLRQYDLSNAHANLAQAYMLVENYESALKSSRKSKNILRLMEIDECPPESSQLASILEGWALQGLHRHEEAAEVLQEVVQVYDGTISLCRTTKLEFGLAHQALAAVQTSLNQLEAAYASLQAGRSIFRTLLGDNHFRTAQMCLKIAEHHARRAQCDNFCDSLAGLTCERENARRYFGDALTAFAASGCHKPELARALWKHWIFERDNQGSSSASTKEETLAMEGKTADLRDKARYLFEEVVGKSKMRGGKALTDKDFDGIVRFWSR